MRLFFLVLLCLAMSPCPAGAHGVFIFARQQGEQICTESYYSRKNKVRGGIVTMAEANGAVLATGRTNEAGLYCFALPLPLRDLYFFVDAGPGHRGRFVLAASSLQRIPESLPPQKAGSQEMAMGPSLPEEQIREEGRENNTRARMPSPVQEKKETLPAPLDEARIRALVAEEVSSQLAAWEKKQKTDPRDASPGLKEALGGAGLLAGLGTLIYWLRQRAGKA